jgi:hypothetical protein
MKHKMLALILALTVVSWAQEATQTAPAAPQQSTAPEKAKCECCDKMASADAKDAHSCCARHDHSADGKEAMMCSKGKDGKSCCGGKDAKSCMRADKGASCCKDCAKDKAASACCGGKCEKGCCKKIEHASMKCCHGEKRA